MGEISTIGVDLAKSVFQVHGADASGAVVFRKKLRRSQVLSFFAAQPSCTVAMEACSSSHYWAREISTLGHAVRRSRRLTSSRLGFSIVRSPSGPRWTRRRIGS